MDPFTQRILERAEQRSKTLGISKTTKFPLSEFDQMAKDQQQQLAVTSTATTSTSKPLSAAGGNTIVTSSPSKSNLQKKCEKIGNADVTISRTSPPSKVKRQFAVDKENMDVGIEINITAGRNVEVQVEVEEQEIDEDGNTISSKGVQKSTSGASIRDSSRNRLQRLGALYSETDNLSSPIHRTEGRFHEENSPAAGTKRPNQKLGKLVALADSIKCWEDDLSHPDYKHSKAETSKGATTECNKSPVKAVKADSRYQPKSSPSKSARTDIRSVQLSAQQEAAASQKSPKQLKWDKAVMDSLEAQGFQRRESSTTKLRYEYSSEQKSDESEEMPPPQRQKQKTESKNVPSTGSVSTVAHSSTTVKTSKQDKPEDRQQHNIRAGLVSGRAAAFESKTVSTASAKTQKDPAEMSLKERMMMFEKNKGQALLPKAAFAMAAPVTKVREDLKKYEQQYQRGDKKTTETPFTKGIPCGDVKVRDKVAALIAAPTTISENSIKADLQRQRQEDMDVLANRFNRQKEAVSGQSVSQPKTGTKMTPPPPPPPMPERGESTRHQHIEARCMISNKRRSPGQRVDSAEVLSTLDDVKRIKVTSTAKDGRLYPALSDIETSESDSTTGGNCTTATISEYSTEDRQQNHRSQTDKRNVRAYDDDEEDVDLNESFMESEDDVGICNVSLGREIMQVVRTNESQSAAGQLRKQVRYADANGDIYYGDSSMTSDGSAAGVDDYLDEAFDEDEEDDDTENDDGDHHSNRRHNQSNGTTSSNSFSYKKQPKKFTQYQTISEDSENNGPTSSTTSAHSSNGHSSDFSSPIKSAVTVNPADDNVVTLVHTVSFYRRQQTTQSNNSTPVRKIHWDHHRQMTSPSSTRTEDSDDDDSDSQREENNAALVQEKIKKLLDEVCKQQQVIGQISQALNLCAATIEFSGSTESVEGERHLLVATHRRQAALDEVQRLRVEKSLRPSGAPREKGRLTVREITIPLRQDYIRKLAADTISGHHLVCLLKYNENVLATKTVPTLPGLLAVKFPDVLQLNNVYADFKITVEIYGMTAQREVLPHEVKYHINLNKKSGAKTPKSKKGGDSRLIMPMVQSPAGPNVVRTPALVHYGFAIFSLREIQRNTWTLNQISNVSPLEGTIHMKVNCELSVSVEYKGFLTMFEDISGFGAWHRRWCHLNGHVLNYWKYPDDEKKKAPMGSIDLYACSSTKITTAPRDICARLNTLLLECQRPSQDGDAESLLIVPKGKVTVVRYLLSADTKEERDEWSAYFNKALTLLRAWGSKH